MTSMLSPSKLPEAIEEFAVGKGGEAWRERHIAGFSTIKTVEKLGEVSATSQGFRCKQVWVPGTDRKKRAETAYALYEGETRVLSHIPQDVLRHCRIVNEDGSPADSVELEDDDLLTVTRQTTYDLTVPAMPQLVKGTIHITHDVNYTLNGETILLGNVVNGRDIYDDEALEDFVHPPSDIGLEVVEHYLSGTPPPQPAQQDELEMLINGPGSAMCQAERCARQMFEIMDILR